MNLGSAFWLSRSRLCRMGKPAWDMKINNIACCGCILFRVKHYVLQLGLNCAKLPSLDSHDNPSQCLPVPHLWTCKRKLHLAGWLTFVSSQGLTGSHRQLSLLKKQPWLRQPTCSEASQHLPDAVASLAIVTQHVDSKFEAQDVLANSHIIMSYSLASWECHDRRRGVSGSPRMATTSSALQTASGRTWLKCPSRQIYPSAPMNFSCSSGPPHLQSWSEDLSAVGASNGASGLIDICGCISVMITILARS